MEQNVQTIAVVGGGTAAWLTAAYISNKFPHIKITVVDKEIGNSIGVGEGTTEGFSEFMESCGFAREEWFPKVDATLKGGIHYTNWHKEGNHVWHPFTITNEILNGFDSLDLWTQAQHLELNECLRGYESSVKQHRFDPTLYYAYHVDCGKLVVYIQDKLKDKVVFIKSEMTHINRTDSQHITSLNLANGQEVVADLYIDCTGFRSLLHQSPERVTLEGRLFCDTAVCGRVDYNDKETELKSHTVADAVEHGWIWKIPTQSRMGTGLIFNRSITDVDTAKSYLVQYWDNRIDNDDLRVIDWTPFYIKNAWHENVVSIGLSSGFIEPLESTGIVLMILDIFNLASKLSDGVDNTASTRYNGTRNKLFEKVVDFVSLHYFNSQRRGPFWEWVQKTITVTPHQREMIELINGKVKLPARTPNYYDGFPVQSWMIWYAGLKHDVTPKTTITSNAGAERLLIKNQQHQIEYLRTNSKTLLEEINRINHSLDK